MKSSSVLLCVIFVAVLICALCDARGVRKKKLDAFADYEASGDYFDMTMKSVQLEELRETSTQKAPKEEMAEDDGVTCSESNITNVLYGFDLESHVLVIYKINVSAHERELVL